MHKTKLCAVLALVFASFAASATITMIDGTNNGVSEKYNKTCLDVAYKNAKEDLNGNKTSLIRSATRTALKSTVMRFGKTGKLKKPRKTISLRNCRTVMLA